MLLLHPSRADVILGCPDAHVAHKQLSLESCFFFSQDSHQNSSPGCWQFEFWAWQNHYLPHLRHSVHLSWFWTYPNTQMMHDVTWFMDGMFLSYLTLPIHMWLLPNKKPKQNKKQPPPQPNKHLKMNITPSVTCWNELNPEKSLIDKMYCSYSLLAEYTRVSESYIKIKWWSYWALLQSYMRR